MRVRERILIIRLIEKLQSWPQFAEVLGVEVRGEVSPDISDLKESMRVQNKTVI